MPAIRELSSVPRRIDFNEAARTEMRPDAIVMLLDF